MIECDVCRIQSFCPMTNEYRTMKKLTEQAVNDVRRSGVPIDIIFHTRCKIHQTIEQPTLIEQLLKGYNNEQGGKKDEN